MSISEILRLVLINLKQNKSKVFLTSLGIIVGAATIVMVIAIGEGGKQDVAEQFKNLNAGTITISQGEEAMPMMGGGGMMSGGGPSSAGGSAPSSGGGGGGSRGGGMSAMAAMMSDDMVLTLEDLDDILFFVPDITTGAISATADIDALSEEMDESAEFTVVGTQPSYSQISNLTPIVGSFITEDELESESRTVVLGYDVAMEMFDNVTNAYDSKIEIDGRDYVVNGVFEQMGTVVSGINPDTSIFMPYTTAEKYIFERNFEPQLSIMATDVDVVDSVMSNIESVLKQSKPSTTFSITDAGATMDAAMQSANTLSLLLLAVAVIVFVVGGIGIMNVLFVSVKERTREIGVLKALGTKKLDILLLFLIEAGMIGVIGGILGVGVSFAVLPLMEYTNMTVVVTEQSVILAFSFAVFTGTAFGFYPAFKASNLIPIEALNNE